MCEKTQSKLVYTDLISHDKYMDIYLNINIFILYYMRIYHIYIYMHLYKCHVPNGLLNRPIFKKDREKKQNASIFHTPKKSLPLHFSILPPISDLNVSTSSCTSSAFQCKALERSRTRTDLPAKRTYPRDAPLRQCCNKFRKIELQVRNCTWFDSSQGWGINWICCCKHWMNLLLWLVHNPHLLVYLLVI